ncbi:MAG: helix-turn-helix domain-containing protein, partial [Weeksellaceae bacterium]|nr:helix-turn-helix domain-containing protein [Weeksellaceae bacterium]
TTLLDEKGKLEKANSWGIFFIILLLLSTVFLAVILYKKYQKEKIILQKYALLQKKLQNQDYILENRFSNDNIQDRKTVHVAETLKKILLEKLKKFEENKDFNQKGLTIQKLAAQLETNSIYLSQVIKEYRGMTFNKYVTNLRIRNITYLLYEKRIYLNYTIESLAKECGIASRQNFSDLFYEINGIRPTDFIRKRKKQLENKADNESLKDVPGLLPDN